MEVKTCVECGETKALTDYYQYWDRRRGKEPQQYYRRRCKRCHIAFVRLCQKDRDREKNLEYRRVWRRKKLYGVTPEVYDKKLMEQDRRCRICGEIAPLVIDHDHRTGKTRDLLCNACNKGLGHFRDEVNVLKAAVFYLEQHGQ